jgi:hypothetical protein
MKDVANRQERARPYRKSGFHGLERALTKGGLSALDGRSAAARAVGRWKAAVEADLGDLSTAERTLLDAAAGDVALLAVADSWLREHAETVINRRRKTFAPLVAERLRVASHLADLLRTLGLKRRAREVNLREYLASRPASPSAPAEATKGAGGANGEGASPESAAPDAQNAPAGREEDADGLIEHQGVGGARNASQSARDGDLSEGGATKPETN